jgi:hypothetical protein
MNLLYSPPSGDYPQELPDRWRFGDGTVRTDLQSISNEELASLGWTGPISFLIPRQLDENGNDLVESWDYDSNNYKAVWYKAEKRFVVVEINVDDTPYLSGEHIKLNVGPSDWKIFKKTLLISPVLNSYIASVMLVAPLAAISLPATLLKIETDSFQDFEHNWEAITTIVPISEELKQEMIELAKQCNLPLRFIDIIS